MPMRKLEIENRIYTDRDVFVIAEIGSNHGGDPDLCEKMIIGLSFLPFGRPAPGRAPPLMVRSS